MKLSRASERRCIGPRPAAFDSPTLVTGLPCENGGARPPASNAEHGLSRVRTDFQGTRPISPWPKRMRAPADLSTKSVSVSRMPQTYAPDVGALLQVSPVTTRTVPGL